MNDFAKEYERQCIAAFAALDEKLFPQERMDRFQKESEDAVTAGRNLCPCGDKTMSRIYPVGNHLSDGWICPKHAQEMWQAGILRGAIVFDMTKDVVS